MTEEERNLQEAADKFKNDGTGSKYDFIAGGKFIISLRRHSKLGEWQICPKCFGQGIVSKPSWVAGDVSSWIVKQNSTFQCDVCNGSKILSRPIVK